MKTLTVLLVSTILVSQIYGYLIKVPTKSVVAPAAIAVTDHKQWMVLQKLMIPLFENVCETSKNPDIYKLAQEFTFDSSDYAKPEAVTNLKQLMSNGLLSKGVVFSEFDIDHMNELKAIHEVLISAKTFDIFYKTAAWARQNLNCGLYVNALYMAIQNRRDLERLSIPAPYELLPNYFIDQNVIVQASLMFAQDNNNNIVPTESIHTEGNFYIIDANYTALFYDNNDDSKLAYFREDVGLNSYYFLRKLRLAPWLNDDINSSYGENMFQMMKQFMARYNLERYANGLPELDSLNWNSSINFPYDPMLIYSNGDEFDHRTTLLELPENEDLRLLQTIENNLIAIVSHMRQNGYNKTQIMNHLMEILVTGDRSYETLARKLLGKDFANNGATSVLEHYMTSLRDPMFWKINKKIVDMVDEALKILPAYARNELYFPGVEVVNIDVKKMMTAYDYFQFDVTDALKTEEDGFKIKIGQPRLNHKQFTIKVNISSLVSQKGMLKIYLGPKILPGELTAKKHQFTLLDMFDINLKIGSNVITRSSDEMKHFAEDFMDINTIRKKVEDAGFGLDALPLKTVFSQVGYPSRLILPKGTFQGLPLQIFVFVAPYAKASTNHLLARNNLEFNTAILSPGFPLDLIIEDRHLFELPNSMIKYITVSHKGDSKVENYGGPGVTKSWYSSNAYDPSSRPNYNSKNGQYGGKPDYSRKVNDYNEDTSEVILHEERIDDDNYDVIGLDDNLNLLQNSKLDYSSHNKFRKPFDYKTKKGQFDRKDYSAKRDYTKYRTTTIINEDTSTLGSLILNSTESNLNIVIDNDDVPRHIINIGVVQEFETTEKEEINRDSLEVEPLPLPAMLQRDSENKEKFDYKPKKIERNLKIKTKKIELESLIKDAKTKHRLVKLPDNTRTPLSSEENFDKVDFKEKIKLDSKFAKHRAAEPFVKTNASDVNVLDTLDKINLTKDSIKLNSKTTKNRTSKVEDETKSTSDGKHIEDNSKEFILSTEDIETDNQITKNIYNTDTHSEIHTDITQEDSSDNEPIYLLEVIKKHTPTMYDYLTRKFDSVDSS